MKQPLVSLITPCYNGESFVHRFLNSVLAQTYESMELIFINDGSTDRTEEIVLSYRERFAQRGLELIYLYQENAGQAAAINKGLEIFKGEYFSWPDSDDWLTADAVEKKVAFLEAHTECGLVISRILLKNEAMRDIGVIERRQEKEDNYFLDLITERNAYYAPIGNLVRREVFLAAVPDKRIYESRGGQNWQMLLPIAYHCHLGYIEETLGYCLVRTGSHSRVVKTKDALLEQVSGYEDVLLHTLESLQPEGLAAYLRLIQVKYAKKRLYLGYRFGDKILLKEQRRILQTLDALSARDRLLYFCGCTGLNRPVNAVRKPLRALRGFVRDRL